MRLPDFLGLGVQKGGTTYLQYLLQQHPSVQMAVPKELHFFTNNWDKGVEWYSHHFVNVSPEYTCGEITPYYFFHPLSAKRINSIMPWVKLIVLLRDPVERSLSQYFHSVRLKFETLPLLEALDAEKDRLAASLHNLEHKGFDIAHQQFSYVGRSQYESQYKVFIESFDSSQLLFIKSESLFQNTLEIFPLICQFLEIENFSPMSQLPVYQGNWTHSSETNQAKRFLRDYLSQTYEWAQAELEMTWDPML